MSVKIRRGKWHYRFMLNGIGYSGSTGLAGTERNRNAAMRIEAEKHRLVTEGRADLLKLEVRLLRDAAESFLEWSKGEHRSHPATYQRHKTSFASLTEFFGSLPVHAITPGRIEDYKSWRRNTHKVRDVTVRHDLHALSVFFQYCRKQNWCPRNPVREVAIPGDADSQRQHAISDTEEAAYFAAARRRFPALYDVGRLMLLQGLRPDEVMRVQVADVDLAAGTLRVRDGKTKAARRTLTLTGEARSILAARSKKAGVSGWLFPGKTKGTRLTKLNGSHDKILEQTGLSFCLYDLRHTFATRLAAAGVDSFTLAAILGHSGVRCVSRYVHPSAEHQAEAMRRYEATLKPALRLVK